MARGWESKSVEDQQAEFTRKSEKSENGVSSHDKQRITERQRLQLARVNVANQLEAAQNPRYKELLKKELDELDRKLAQP